MNKMNHRVARLFQGKIKWRGENTFMTQPGYIVAAKACYDSLSGRGDAQTKQVYAFGRAGKGVT
jgi:hypothetical protein